MTAEVPNTAMADYAILSLARKPRAYSELATFASLLSGKLTPESLHGDRGHMKRLEDAGLIKVEKGPPGRQEVSRSIISITEQGIGHMRASGFPLMPLGETTVKSFPKSTPG